MRDLVKIYEKDIVIGESTAGSIRLKLEEQIKRKDFTILNITKVDNMEEGCLDCYVDYEFWSGKWVVDIIGKREKSKRVTILRLHITNVRSVEKEK